MSGLFSEIGGVTGGAASQALAFAAGFAAGRALTPAGVTLEQDAWADATVRRLAAETAAEAAADRLMTPGDAATEATYSGYESSRFQALYNIALTGPGLGELLTAIRRQTISGTQVSQALGKLKLDPAYDSAILDLQNVYLTPEQVALGIVRSVVADPGILPVTLDTSGSNVAQYPVYAGDALAEAAAGGVNEDRLRVMVGEIGLPMSAQQAASAYFRGDITLGAYYQAILEGDTRPEWADSIMAQARQIATAHEYLENYLRGYTTDFDTALAGAAKWGMSTDDATVVFQNMGRPLSIHNITKGLARGAAFNPEPGEITDPYVAAAHESNLKPGYYDLAIAAEQYTWPSYFVLKDLVPSPISVEQCTQILEWSGWEPSLAADTAQSFAAGSSTTKKTTASQYATQYKAGKLTPTEFATKLQGIGYSAPAATDYIDSVDAEPVSAAVSANLTKIRTNVAKGGLTDAQATTLLEAEPINPATIPDLIAAWKRGATIESTTATTSAAG